MPHIRRWAGARGVGRVKGEGGWVNDAFRHRRPSCVYSGPDIWPQQPDHTTRRADIKWNSLGPQATLLMHPSDHTGSVWVLCGLIGSAKSHP